MPAGRPFKTSTKIRNAIYDRDPEALAWSLIDHSFNEAVKGKSADAKHWHQLLRELSVIMVKNWKNVPGEEPALSIEAKAAVVKEFMGE